MIERRVVLLGMAAWVSAAGVALAKTGEAVITLQGQAGMNPGADGVDKPTTLQVVQLNDTAAFDAADYLSLQNPAGLAAGFVKVDYVTVPPGAPVKKAIALEAGTTAIGFVAGFLNPSGRAFRASFPVKATKRSRFKVMIGPAGMTASRG